MAGKLRRSGRKPIPGSVVRVTLRYRAGVHPEALADLVQALQGAGPVERGNILVSALLSSDLERTWDTDPAGQEAENLLDDLLDF